MSVSTKVEKQEIGFRWHISVDKELHIDSGTRTPDKVSVHASLEGHTDTYVDAGAQLKLAREDLLKTLVDVEKQATESKPKVDT